MAIVEFVDDDKGFFDWMKKNPLGHFVNTPRKINANYMVLHRSGCQHTKGTPRPDNEFTKAYRKICAVSVVELQNWVKNNGRSDGSFSKICKSCSSGTLEPTGLNSHLLIQNEDCGYFPTKEDVEVAYRMLTCQGESISIDAVLDQLEVNAKKEGLSLKIDWRMIMEINIEKWAKKR